MLLNFTPPQSTPRVIEAPKPSSVDINALLNLAASEYSGLQKVGGTDYYYGNNRMYEPTSYSGGKGAPANMKTFGGQNFVPVDADITGFNKSEIEDGKDKGEFMYSPSMAYINANKPMSIPAPTPNIMSFLSSPNMNLQPAQTSYGAGRFLNNGLIPLNFGSPNDTTGSDS